MSAEKGGSRFREDREARESERRKEIEVSTAVNVFPPYKKRLCTLSKHELEDNSSNCGKITVQQKHSYFQDIRERKAL